MKLKDISQAITTTYPSVTCKTQSRKHQIILQYDGETTYLLSPYYQQRLETDKFNEKDLAAILIEVDRIIKLGY